MTATEAESTTPIRPTRPIRPTASAGDMAPTESAGDMAPTESVVSPGWLLDGDTLFDLPGRQWIDAGSGDDLDQHEGRYGPRPTSVGVAGERLLHLLAEVGLGGRGGAHFPVAVKWQTALAAVRERSCPVVVVANAAEGEPGIAKDAALLRRRPHLVLDGLMAAAEVLGAQEAVIWLHDGDQDGGRALAAALTQRRSRGRREPAITFRASPARYLSGESNAVVRALDGGPALPWFRVEPPARRGVAGHPTVVQNVETYARVALLARYGQTAMEAGSLISLLETGPPGPSHTRVGRIRVHEAASTTTLAELVALTPPERQGPGSQALLLGGYGGVWVPWRQASSWQVGRLDRRRGPDGDPTLGAGLVAPLPVTVCGVAQTAAILEFLADSSAKQCGPCLFGTRELAQLWRRLADGGLMPSRFSLNGFGRRRDRDISNELASLTSQMVGRGACALPDGSVSISRSALTVFGDEVRAHLSLGCTSAHGANYLPIPSGVMS